MKRILFVDDETKVIEDLQRVLRPQQDHWDMAFALGGEAALALMEASPFDVIVSDMRMPKMDGAALLAQVRDQYPGVVRIVLSGQSEVEATLRAVPVAHQFLVKPCDPDSLRVAVGRASGLFEVLNNPTLASVVGQMRELPALPRTYAALQNALADPKVSLDKIASIVEQDVGISAKTLQLVNSALFGLRQNIATVRTAVTYLGVRILQQLILSAEVFRVFQDVDSVAGFSLEDVYSHSQLTARIAGAMRASDHLPEAPVVAGLLHDVGKLILATRMPNQFATLLATAREEQRPLHDVEREMLGISHCELGACLLGLWGLPCLVVEAVAHHHEPDRVPHQKLDAITAVYLANLLAHKHRPHRSEDGLIAVEIDEEYLKQLGVADRLPEWETMAESAAQELARAI